ncbi:MAG: AI-2E family transporter [Actinomycetota bacterium]|nr:AI-2E family transporter [Actinomycetota bacterium]HZY66091.1 AI-2E family transporter [Rubrobacteraceae bacterium]
MVYAGIGLVFAILLLSYLVYKISLIVLVFLLTLLFSIIISGPVDYLEHRGIGRAWGTLLVLGGTALTIYLAGLALADTVTKQAEEFAQSLPELLAEFQALLQRLQDASGIDLGLQLGPADIFERLRGFLSGDVFAVAADVGGSIANGVSLAVVALIATIYLVINPRPLVQGFVAFFPAEWRPRTREILSKMYNSVQKWFLGQLTSMTIIGVFSAIALSIIGIPFAVLLGLISGLISFIPFIGPVISVIPPTLLGLTSDDPLKALWVIAAYLIIQAIESNLIQPIVMSRAVSLHPAVVVFALLIMGTLFGFVGLLLAVPLVAALHVLARELWIDRMNRIGTDPDPPHKEPSKPPKKRMRKARLLARQLLRNARDLFRS